MSYNRVPKSVFGLTLCHRTFIYPPDICRTLMRRNGKNLCKNCSVQEVRTIQRRYIDLISAANAEVHFEGITSPMRFSGLSPSAASKLMVGPPAVVPAYASSGPTMQYLLLQAKQHAGLLDGFSIPPSTERKEGMIVFNGIRLKDEATARSLAEYFPPSEMEQFGDGTWYLKW